MYSSEAETVALPLPADTLTYVTAAQPPEAGNAANSSSTPPCRLAAHDMHRLALQAKLTELGVPPAPGDRTALAQLSALDDQLISTVLNWLSCAADPGQAATRRATPYAGSVRAPERHADPRLLSW